MNYGQSVAVMVLAGEQMGLQVTNAGLARDLLDGKSLHPMDGVSIEKEAMQIHNQIRTQPELVKQANQHCIELCATYNLA